MCRFINLNKLFGLSLHGCKIFHGYQSCFNIWVRKYILELFSNDIVVMTQYTGQHFHVYNKCVDIILCHIKLEFVPSILLLASSVTPRVKPF